MAGPDGESAPPDLVTLNRVSRRAGRVGSAASAASYVAGVFVAGWLLAGVRTNIGGWSGPHPTDWVPIGVGLLVGEAIRYRRDRRTLAACGPLSTPLVAGLPLRQQRRVWSALYSGRPSTDPLVRLVTATTARRIRQGPGLRITATGFLALAVLTLTVAADMTVTTRVAGVLIAVAFVAIGVVQARTATAARVYLGHAGEDGAFPMFVPPARRAGRLRRLWFPLWADGVGANPRVWFTRALATLGALVACAGVGIGLLLVADPLQHHLYDVALYMLLAGVVLLALAMPLELILIGCLLAGIWTFLRGRTSRPTPHLGHP